MIKLLKQNPTDIKRVLILGAECTGKSTLAKDLANHFNTYHVPEYMRTYLENKPIGYVCQYEDLLPIAIGQIQSENELLNKAHQYLFCDTSLFEIMTYAFWYFDKCPDDIIQAVKDSQYELILLTDEKGVQWQADGMRDMPEGRHMMTEYFKEKLINFGFDFYLVSGNKTERLMKVERLIKKT